MIALVAVANAADLGHPAIDAVYIIAVSATVATMRLIYLWWTRRAIEDDPLPALVAAGALAAWLAVVPKLVDFGFDPPGGDAAGALVLLATVPLLVVAAIVDALRDRPGRFHGVAHEVISWLLLSGAILVVYTGVVGGVGLLLGRERPVASLVLTTAIIAVLADPVRRRIKGAADRLVWGARDDPLEVVRRVVEHVGADSGDELLPALAESLQRDLRLDFVAIDVSDANAADGWRREAGARSRDDVHADGRARPARRGRRTARRRLGVRADASGARRARTDGAGRPARAGGRLGSPGRRPAADRASPSCRRARRSGAGCGATSTTASVLPSTECRWACAPPCARSCAATLTTRSCPRASSSNASPTKSTRSPLTSSGSCVTSYRRRSINSG